MNRFLSAIITIAALAVMTCGNEKNVKVETTTDLEHPAVTDPRDGRVYRTVSIDSVTWIAEDIGFNIEGSVCLDDCAKSGRRYTWDAAVIACAGLGDGWSMPKYGDWQDLNEAVRKRKADGHHDLYNHFAESSWWSTVEDYGKCHAAIFDVKLEIDDDDELPSINWTPKGAHIPTRCMRIDVPAPEQPEIPAIEMVFVKGGAFTMGCTPKNGDGGDCRNTDTPARRVTVGDFYIGKYEITRRQWIQVIGGTLSGTQEDDHPIGRISWYDATRFISRLNSISGKAYRLPTEAEWEYAARGGAQSKGYRYSGGSNIDDVAWHSGNCESRSYPIGTKRSNELGIHDMTGNVWEWTNDFYDDYTATVKTDHVVPPPTAHRVRRGGSCYDDNLAERTTGVYERNPINSGMRYHDVGFRLVLPAHEQ